MRIEKVSDNEWELTVSTRLLQTNYDHADQGRSPSFGGPQVKYNRDRKKLDYIRSICNHLPLPRHGRCPCSLQWGFGMEVVSRIRSNTR